MNNKGAYIVFNDQLIPRFHSFEAAVSSWFAHFCIFCCSFSFIVFLALFLVLVMLFTSLILTSNPCNILLDCLASCCKLFSLFVNFVDVLAVSSAIDRQLPVWMVVVIVFFDSIDLSLVLPAIWLKLRKRKQIRNNVRRSIYDTTKRVERQTNKQCCARTSVASQSVLVKGCPNEKKCPRQCLLNHDQGKRQRDENLTEWTPKRSELVDYSVSSPIPV